ncbi:MAG: chalcone isomerase family protein [Burkholderiales bacterium]
MVTRLLVLMALALPASAAEVAGVRFEERARVEGAELALKGAGLRKRFFFQVYAIGLYVADAKADPVAQGGAKRVAIHMLRDVDAETFTQALVDGMRPNHDEATMRSLAPRIERLAAIMREVKEAKEGMAIALDWAPGAGTRIAIDGKPAGAPIEGEDFYASLLRIWLGEKPVQDDLKQALLGG